MKATMPGTMGRVLGGFRRTLDQTDRLPVCHLADQPQASRGWWGMCWGMQLRLPSCCC